MLTLLQLEILGYIFLIVAILIMLAVVALSTTKKTTLRTGAGPWVFLSLLLLLPVGVIDLIENIGKETGVWLLTSDFCNWVDTFAVNFLVLAAGSGFYGVYRQFIIGERLVREQRKTHEQFRTLLTNLPGLVLLYQNYTCIYANHGAETITGYTNEELLSMDYWDLLHPDYQQVAIEGGKAINKGEKLELPETSIIVTKDGRSKWVDARMELIEFEQKRTAMIYAIDITDRKEAQENVQFLHSLLRHDMGNKIQGIEGCLAVLDQSDLPERSQPVLATAHKICNEIIDLSKKISSLQTVEESLGEVVPIDFFPLLKNVVSTFSERASLQGFQIELESPEKQNIVLGGLLLPEIFSNIIENTLSHSTGKFLKITIESTPTGVTLIFEDDGKGIPEKKRDKIFTRGFKDEMSKGSGIGLFLTKTIVECYKGEIVVTESSLGGARFEVKLLRP